MTLFQHPVWEYVKPYAHVTFCGVIIRLDFLQMPDDLRALALEVVVNCISCGKIVKPLRARAKSDRARIAGTAIERRLFYAPTCTAEVDAGCSRTKLIQQHKDDVRRIFGFEERP
jgi:hypothetical protein